MRRSGPFWLAVLTAISTLALPRAADPPTTEPPVPESLPHRGEGYIGAGNLFHLDAITVVYPAGPGADVETNRRSAVARARFLERSHGVRAHAAPDNRLTDEERKGNLLLLGWDNALLGSDAVPSPFKRTPQGFEFLGLASSDPDADLLFYHRSPIDADHFIVFWSRIDPERDRLMMLPGVGSDWAMIPEFVPLQQGMFLPGSEWPPKRDPRAEADHAGARRDARKTATRSAEHVDVVYEPSRVPPAELDAIVAARESALRKAAELLGGKLDGFRAVVFVYDDEPAKKSWTGVEGDTHSVPREREMHMSRRAARSATPHEELHLIARQVFGPSVVTSLYEGFAYALQGSWRGLDPLVSAALLAETRRLPALADLLDEERFRQMPDPVAIPAAAALAGWLRSLGGDAARKAFVIPEASLASLGAAIGKPAPELQAPFDAWLAARAAERAADIAYAKAEADAQERYAAADFAGMAAALKRAVDAKPTDPQGIFNWASALMRADRLDEAGAAIRRMLALPLGPRESRFVIFGHYQMGRILDLAGRRDEALAEYRKVLELPDQHDAHRLARERIETPATKEQLE